MPSRRLDTARACAVACAVLAAAACATAEDTGPSGRPRSGRGGTMSPSDGDVSSGSAGMLGASGALGSSGNAGDTGAGGVTGSGGSSGSPADGSTGSAGSATTGGSSGSAGAGGTNGSSGSANTGGSSGSSGSAGRGGSAGTGGTAGRGGTGGTAGTAGSAGTSGTSGNAGTGGTAGSAGTGGSGGTNGAGGGPTCSVAGIVFCDDFEDGNANGWTTTGGTWSVISDQSHVYAGGSGSFNASAGSSWGDQTVEARMKILQFGGSGSSYRAGILARNAGSSNFYALALDAAGDLRILRGSSSPSGASGTCEAVASGLPSVTNAWVKLKLQVSGAASSVRIRTWLNDGPVHDCTTTSSTIASGNTGVMSYGSSTRAEFDDFRVSSP